MNDDHQTRDSSPAQREALRAPIGLTGPGELLSAVPHLLGFHPDDSAVLIGMHDRTLVVTARLDLPNPRTEPTWNDALGDTLQSMTRAGVGRLVVAIYPHNPASVTASEAGPSQTGRQYADAIAAAASRADVTVTDRLWVHTGRWGSYDCTRSGCCPPIGSPLPTAVSALQVAATVAGTSVVDSRERVTDRFAPDPEVGGVRHALAGWDEAASNAAVRGHAENFRRAATRRVFAAARASTRPGWVGPDSEELAYLGAALRTVGVRDAVWLAVDAGRVDGEPLWLDLARRLPDPYRAGPLFLAGWQAWRRGDGAVARIAAEHCVSADPHYTAALLLTATLDRGIDPRTLPRLTRTAGKARQNA